MMTLLKQKQFTFNSLLEDIRGSKCCVIKVRQYSFTFHTLYKNGMIGHRGGGGGGGGNDVKMLKNNLL